MASYAFGAAAGFASWSGFGPIYAPGAPLPGGRICSDGASRAGIVSLGTYAGYRNGAGSVQLILGGAATGYFGIGAGQGQWTGQVGTNLWIVNGGSTTFYINVTANTYFSHGGGGTTYDSDPSGADSWSGQPYTVVGYILPPAAPTMSTPVPNSDGTQVSITLADPSDNGDSGITGRKIQRADDIGMTTNVSTTSAVVGANTITGLTPGKDYYYRATAGNALTDAAGVQGGAWTSVVKVTQPDPALGRIRNAADTAFVQLDGKIRAADDSGWVQPDGRIRSADNTSWGPLGN